MKKKLIGSWICMMLVTIAFVPDIGADEDIETMTSLSQEEYDELDSKLSELNDQLLAAVTLEQIETIIRNILTLLDAYDLLPADTNIDDEVELMKNAYIEQMQNQPESTIVTEETIKEECLESGVIQPLSMSYGWICLGPWYGEEYINYHGKGFQIMGVAAGPESYNSLKITNKKTAGFVYFLNFNRPLREHRDDEYLRVVYWYLVFGFGKFDVICTWNWENTPDCKVIKATVAGLKVFFDDYENQQGSPAPQTQSSTWSSEQLIDTTQQYVTS